MLAIALAIGLLTNACPLKIGIARDGALFSTRMQGWYRTSQETLADVLRGGCYNDANPSKITAVNLEIAPNAPKVRVDQVFSILEKAGWPKAKVIVETWANDPQEPRL
jgi:hypothetical protein